MNKSNIFGYLLGLLIFVIGIPALMWLASGRPWSYRRYLRSGIKKNETFLFVFHSLNRIFAASAIMHV